MNMKLGSKFLNSLRIKTQILLRSSVLTILEIDEVNVTLENTETFGSVLSGEGVSAGGGLRCC